MICGYFFTDYGRIRNKKVYSSLRVFSFVLIDPEYGAMIFDTGSPTAGEAVLSNLKKMFGLAPEDIRFVFNTHLHPDHFGNNHLFKKAKIIFSKKDFDFQRAIAEAARSDGDFLAYLHTNFVGYRTSFDADSAGSYRYYLKNYFNEKTAGIKENRFYIEDNPDIPPFVSIFHTPGHIPWHYSYTLKTGADLIHIAGDSISTRLALQTPTPDEQLEKEPHVDFPLYRKTMAGYFSKKGIIACGHDRPFYAADYKTIKSKVFNTQK